MVTGKNKKQFEKWYDEFTTYGTIITFTAFPFEMQIGVYLAYYDGMGVDLMVDVLINDENEKRYTCYISDDVIESCDTRNEAYKEAFKQADRLKNEELNK